MYMVGAFDAICDTTPFANSLSTDLWSCGQTLARRGGHPPLRARPRGPSSKRRSKAGGLERDARGNLRLRTPLRVGAPLLGQVQREAERQRWQLRTDTRERGGQWRVDRVDQS